jgi:hypothetical protein
MPCVYITVCVSPVGKLIVSSKTYRLHLSHLLQRAVHTLLEDLNLLVLLLAQLLKFVSALVKLLGLVLELNLFGLQMNTPKRQRRILTRGEEERNAL